LPRLRPETDAEVRRNLPPDWIALFNRVRGQIRATPHLSRTEAFQQYVEDHPDEVVESLVQVGEFELKSLLRPMLDFYETPPWCVRAILPHLPAAAKILDAGCGTGAILREIVKAWPDREICGIEKEPGRCRVAEDAALPALLGDFLLCTDRFDLIVSNPPYSHALQFVQKAQDLAPVVCMLLRLPWLASMKRAQWHRDNPSHVFVLPRRPSFTGDKRTDATEYAWFLWGAGRPGAWTILDVETGKEEEVPF